MTSQEIMMLSAMAFYLVMIVFIGVRVSRKTKSSEDFYLGGRGVGPWVTAMSAEASDMSGWLLMGLPGLAYATGFADAGWTAIGLVVGTYLNWLFTAKRLRRYSVVAGNAITVPDYFSNRFHDKNRILMKLGAVFTLIFFVVYTSSGFVACGKFFSSVFGFGYIESMLASAVVIVIYTAVGGFLAESIIDFIQGTLMIVVLITIVTLGITMAGGFSAVAETGSVLPGYFSFTESFNPTTGQAQPYSVLNILSGLAWGLGYFGMPHVLLRFMAVRSEKELTKSRRIATTWVIISLVMAIGIGLVGRALLAKNADFFAVNLSAFDPESIFVVLCKGLFSSGLLPLIAGVMLCGVLAAQMSSSDSYLLISSSAVSQNLFKGMFKKKASDKEVIWVSRVTIVIIAAIAVFLAFNPNSSIFDIVSFAWAGFGAVFGPIVVFSLYWRSMNLAGAIAGMLTGGITVFIWKLILNPQLGGIFEVYELLPAFLLASVAIVMVSLLTHGPSESVLKEYDTYIDMNEEV